MNTAVQSYMQDDTDKYYSSGADTMYLREHHSRARGYSQLAHMVKEQEEMVQRIDLMSRIPPAQRRARTQRDTEFPICDVEHDG